MLLLLCVQIQGRQFQFLKLCITHSHHILTHIRYGCKVDFIKIYTFYIKYDKWVLIMTTVSLSTEHSTQRKQATKKKKKKKTIRLSGLQCWLSFRVVLSEYMQSMFVRFVHSFHSCIHSSPHFVAIIHTSLVAKTYASMAWPRRTSQTFRYTTLRYCYGISLFIMGMIHFRQ